MKYRKRNLPAAHGEFITYNRGCRCVECRAANAAYNQNTRKRLGKDYVRNCNLKQVHGLTLQEYNDILQKQNNVCASCGCAETGTNQYGVLPLAVDHDHKTQKRRGLLCMRCNRALGLLRDDPQVLQQLLNYRKGYD